MHWQFFLYFITLKLVQISWSSTGFEKDNSVVCKCNNHAIYCSSAKPRICSDCQHHTYGRHCEFCLPNFYGNATLGTVDACKKCPCSETRSNGSCFVDSDGSVKCSMCNKGYVGHQCQDCAQNYYHNKPNNTCLPCNCHGFGNESLSQICNPTDGTCYHCINSTSGKFCEKCLPGFYLQRNKEARKCVPCFCNGNEDPSVLPKCEWSSGICISCQKNTTGKHCGFCAVGYTGDAILGKNCTKENRKERTIKSNKELVLILSLTLVILISVLACLICICWWRRKTLRSRARFVSVEMRGTSISSSHDLGLIDPITGEPVPDLDYEQEVDTLKINNGNLQIESPYDVEVSDTDRML